MSWIEIPHESKLYRQWNLSHIEWDHALLWVMHLNMRTGELSLTHWSGDNSGRYRGLTFEEHLDLIADPGRLVMEALL